jgi:hypothetical protein
MGRRGSRRDVQPHSHHRVLFADDKLTITFASSRSVHVGLIDRTGIISNRSGFIFGFAETNLVSFVFRNCTGLADDSQG